MPLPFLAPPTNAAARFIGRDLGTVTILSLLGAGASGLVFLGFQRTLRRQVAVKVIAKNEMTPSRVLERFRREAEIVANLAHPNIVPVHEIGEENDCFFQVMQVIKGDSLQTLMRQRRNHPLPDHRVLPLERTIEIVAAILDGLDYAHEEGIIHHDIKPANILVEARSGRPLIADFGVACTRRTEHDDRDTIRGSPLYMAPEYIAGLETDHRSDLYSVAVMLFEMLVTELPLVEKEPMALLQRKVTNPAAIFAQTPCQVSPAIDKALESIVLKGLAPRPNERYPSGRAFGEDLKTYKRLHAQQQDRRGEESAA